ncbi:MAG: ATP-binding cassette domain-containing protein [Conexibacter sp.]
MSKRYSRRPREIVALDDVSFEVAEGDFFAVIGSAGSGKSTLLKCVTGLDPHAPDEGIVRFRGQDTARMPRAAREHMLRHEIGCVFDPEGPNEREVVQYVSMPLVSAGVRYSVAAGRAREMLRRVGAADCAGARLCELAPSEKTRVVLAQALLRGPALLLADEPAASEDPLEREDMLRLLQRVAREDRITVLMTAGDATRISGATHIAELDRGRLRVEPRGDVVPFPSQAKPN